MFSSTASTDADRLASLALLAATELESIQRSRGSDISHVREFLDAITNFSGLDDGMNACPLALDPMGSEMFSEAVSRANNTKIADVDSLNSALSSSIREWSSSLEKAEGAEAVERFKAFCLSIHDFVLRSNSFTALNEKGVFDYDNMYAG